MELYRIQTDPGQNGPPRDARRLGRPDTSARSGPVRTSTTRPTNFEQGRSKRPATSSTFALTGPTAFSTCKTGARASCATRATASSRSPPTATLAHDGRQRRHRPKRGTPIPIQPAARQGRRSAPMARSRKTARRSASSAITSFNNLVDLRKEGDNNFVDTGTAGSARPRSTSSVQQGFLEKSNGNVVSSMVDLITAERWFDANERMIKTQDDATNTSDHRSSVNPSKLALGAV
jgi:flagellar basal body rod protein FlgG